MNATIMHLSSVPHVLSFLYVSACFLVKPQLLTHG
jgi:hypothetical protein